MVFRLGNSGAPRWYDNDLGRLDEYIQHVKSCGATATEIVLHDGDADEFTGRVHVLRQDWERVITAYRDAGISVYFHGSLTPEFAAHNWESDPDGLLTRYGTLLDVVAEIAADQRGSTLVLHGSGDPAHDPATNERISAEFLAATSEQLGRRSGFARTAIELRAEKETRFTAAATSRESVMRIVRQAGLGSIDICWDVAHDFENTVIQEETWVNPDASFLDLVTHLHVHDIGDDGEPHCPPTIGRVPIREALAASRPLPTIMEVRWRMAERLGDPWAVLAESYRVVNEQAGDAGSAS